MLALRSAQRSAQPALRRALLQPAAVRAASNAPERPVILRDLKINESDRRRMSIETVRARLHEAAVARQIPQYIEPTTGGRVWTAPALRAAAEACGCRGQTSASHPSEAPCPFCADDGTTALRHAADARAEVKSSEVLARGGSRLAAMRARLDEPAAPDEPAVVAEAGEACGELSCAGGEA